jgi:hypothetical protein
MNPMSKPLNKTHPRYDWQWKRHGSSSFLQFSKDDKKIGTVVLGCKDENDSWIYCAYLGGGFLGNFYVMKDGKNAVREAYVEKTKGTKTPYIRRAR